MLFCLLSSAISSVAWNTLTPIYKKVQGCITTKRICRLSNVVSSAIHYPHGQWE